MAHSAPQNPLPATSRPLRASASTKTSPTPVKVEVTVAVTEPLPRINRVKLSAIALP